MVPAASLPGVQVESAVYPPTTKPPGSTKTFFLAGAGERRLIIGGKMVNVTAIGVYLEDDALPSLAVKWRGKSAEELFESNEFFRDVVKGPFEKFIQVTPFLPLTGCGFAAKLSDKLIGYWKSVGLYTDAEAKAIEKYMEAFTDEKLPSGSSILFGQSPCESIMIGFSKDDGSLPESWNAMVENKLLSEGVLDSMIGEEGVSPKTKQSVATRLAKLLKEVDRE